jgi:curli biogenesis system outer membrane secretion channel CsgG
MNRICCRLRVMILVTAVVWPTSILLAQRSLSDGVKDLASQIATSAEKAKAATIAVVPLRELAGGQTVLGTYIAESLSTHLVRANLGIVERNLLEKVLKEQAFQETGAVNRETAKRIGQLIGADAIVTGSVTNLKSVIAINCRIIDTRTGRIFAAAEAIVTRDAMVDNVLEQPLGSGGLAVAQRTSEKANTRSSQPEVSFRNIRVQLDSLRVLAGGTITVTLRFTNRSTKELLAALDANPRNIYITDNIGNRYDFKDSSSIGRAQFINIERGSNGWLSCPPGTDAIASIVFSPPLNMDEKGNRFSLAIPAHVGTFYMDNWGYSRVTEDGNFQIYFRDVAPQ